MFGISTHCLHAEPLESALERLSAVTDCIEVMDDGLHHLKSVEPLESYEVRYFFHAPCRGLNIASLHEPIRKASVQVIGEAFSVAAEVDAGVIVHPGYYAWHEEREAARTQFSISLADLRAIAGEYSITFFIENMANWDYFFLRFPDEIDLIEGVGLALDVGHAHLNACLDEFLLHPASHFHLHDNNGKEDSHDTIGHGTIDFASVMEAVKGSRATPIIEVGTFEGCLESIGALRRFA